MLKIAIERINICRYFIEKNFSNQTSSHQLLKESLVGSLDDFSKLKNNYSNKFLILIALLLILLFLASFGPINQSDTVNYYVGYPFQYYLSGLNRCMVPNDRASILYFDQVS